MVHQVYTIVHHMADDYSPIALRKRPLSTTDVKARTVRDTSSSDVKPCLLGRICRTAMTSGSPLVGRPYMDSSSLQASFALAPVPTAHVYSAFYCGIVSMQGHDGLFARRLPIASTCFAHLDT